MMALMRTNQVRNKLTVCIHFATLSFLLIIFITDPAKTSAKEPQQQPDFDAITQKQEKKPSFSPRISNHNSDKTKRHGPSGSINTAPGSTINSRKSQISQWNLSHHVLCEPISQLNDLRLSCPNESQFIVILEAYYSDLYPEIVCPKATSRESKLNKLTGSQLVSILRQLYSPASVTASERYVTRIQKNSTFFTKESLIQFAPTLTAYSNSNPFCLDDLKQSFAAKCSGRQKCRFSRHTDHQFPPCAYLKPGHVFTRYLCVDNGLLIKYCNADTLLASHSTVLNRVKRSRESESSFFEVEQDLPLELDPDERPDQVDTLDFGFVASPGYPMFYATPKSGSEPSCGWTIEAEVGQRVTIKLLDASLAPGQPSTRALELDSAQLSSDLTVEDETARRARQLLLSSLRNNQPEAAASSMGTSVLDSKTSNVYFEVPDGRDLYRKVVFRIDQTDYDLIRSSLQDKLQQVESQCQDYDKLIVRDMFTGTDEEQVFKPLQESSNEIVLDKKVETSQKQEIDLITKLPITLFKNQLIDFANRTIYRRSLTSVDRRIDYRALFESLNPLELIWLYQQNVSLCSNSQQDQLSSEQQKNRISFTSSSHKIRVNLASGHMFNPTNRGVLFWYHKHGCPATLKSPSRSRIIHQNDTVEIFECFEGFVFNDTKLSQRIRRCSHLDQRWIDLDLMTLEPISFVEPRQRIPGCIYAGDLNGGLESNEYQNQLMRQQGDEVAVEVVGVAPSSGNLVSPEVVIGLWNDEQSQAGNSIYNSHAAQASGLYGSPATNSTVENLLAIWHSLIYGSNLQTSESSSSSNSNSDSRSIITHEPLKDRRFNGRDQSESLWARSKALLDRRLLIPGAVVLVLFILINLVFYVIFLVALPKLVRCVCFKSSVEDQFPSATSKRNRQNTYVNVNESTLRSGHSSTLRSQNANKLAYYESDYSVSMGMSL